MDANSRPLVTSQSFTFPSSVPVASSLPSGEMAPRPTASGQAAWLWPEIRLRISVPCSVTTKTLLLFPGRDRTDSKSTGEGTLVHVLNSVASFGDVPPGVAAVSHNLTEPSFAPEA